jgi:tryptophan-rich sensory protein
VIFLKNRKPLLVSLAISLGVGVASAIVSGKAMDDYKALNQPPLAPPGWVFPIVWTILFLCMGWAAYWVWETDKPGREAALGLYGAQLVFNFFWTLIFFNAGRHGIALLWLLVLWALIVCTTKSFYDLRKGAGYLMLPYIVWVTFAAYLNAGVWWLNR